MQQYENAMYDFCDVVQSVARSAGEPAATWLASVAVEIAATQHPRVAAAILDSQLLASYKECAHAPLAHHKSKAASGSPDVVQQALDRLSQAVQGLRQHYPDADIARLLDGMTQAAAPSARPAAEPATMAEKMGGQKSGNVFYSLFHPQEQ